MTTFLLATYLIVLCISLVCVWLSLGWTLGTRHDDGGLIVASAACFVWFLIAAAILFATLADRIERRRAERWL